MSFIDYCALKEKQNSTKAFWEYHISKIIISLMSCFFNTLILMISNQLLNGDGTNILVFFFLGRRGGELLVCKLFSISL